MGRCISCQSRRQRGLQVIGSFPADCDGNDSISTGFEHRVDNLIVRIEWIVAALGGPEENDHMMASRESTRRVGSVGSVCGASGFASVLAFAIGHPATRQVPFRFQRLAILGPLFHAPTACPVQIEAASRVGLIAQGATPASPNIAATWNAAISFHGAAITWTPIGSSPARRKSGTVKTGNPIKDSGCV